VGLDVSHQRPHLSEGRGNTFFLDILFHRMSVIAIFHQSTSLWCLLSSARAATLRAGQAQRSADPYEKLQVAYCALACESRRSHRIVRARSTSIRSIPTGAPSFRCNPFLHPDGSVNRLLSERSFIRFSVICSATLGGGECSGTGDGSTVIGFKVSA